MTRMTSIIKGGAAALAAGLVATPALAAVDAETAYVFNTFSFLIHGALVFFMAVGFAMLEAGLVRGKNVASICLKNTALYAVAAIGFYLVGYNLMYVDVTGWIGTFSFLYNPSEAESALIAAGADAATPEQVAAVIEGGYSVMSDWFFQVVFVATAASVISGTVAERMKIWPFMIFVALLGAFIYPIQASWVWGGGWLTEMGFSDFAGSTLVHSVGGWAALAGAIMVGARKGKFGADGRVHPLPGNNLPLATLGTFILWFGWFGFNGGSQLALGSALDAAAMSIVYANTFLAACAGVVTAMVMTQLIFKKIDLTMVLNGALAGLVAITAGPTLENMVLAMLVGAVGAALAVLAVPLVDKMKIDDVVGAISVHLVAGVWGTLAVGIFGSGSFVTQLIGVVAIGVYVLAVSFVIWGVLKATVGLRVSDEEELDGLDKHELGLEAYPEFGRGSQL
ncbi:ammonium transporter [Caenispirillum bisanense]|uniref:Ammonium transporter n=1 Tax=Caenispirillum bisanense TaxID=414052 RepID=A0A286G3M5_9PROT|nr:ammonium transporter [Caenispirillum bisanense]SOD89739.1 ammonium transporter [Caenispirillum bisanense]